MGRFNRRPRSDNTEKPNGNHEIFENNIHRGDYSGRRPFGSRRGIHKSYQNDKDRRFETIPRSGETVRTQRRPTGRGRGGKRYTQYNNPAIEKGAHNAFKREREDARTTLAGLQTKVPSEVSLILGAKSDISKDYLKQATANDNRHKRGLNDLDEAFKSETTPALLLNVINAMIETEFMFNTTKMLKTNFEGKQSSEKNTSDLEAVCALLRIMIRVSTLNQSKVTFIQGSYVVISDLINTIRASLKIEDDLSSSQFSCNTHETTDQEPPDNEMELDSKLLQSGSISESEEAETERCDNDSICKHSQGNTKSPNSTLLEETESLDEVHNCIVTLEHLFVTLGENVQACILRRRRQTQCVTTVSEEIPLENYRDIPIFPRLGDLTGEIKPNLRVNKAKGAYSGVDDYLDVQFRLLREDFVEPLREGIRAFTGQISGKDKKKIQEIKVYENVQIISAFCGDGLNHILSFDISKLKHIQWNMTKRLKYGSLICLSADNFQTCYFAAIVDSEAKFRRQGQLHVKFAHDPKQVQLLVGSTFTMIESTAYFEAYRPVLSSLQTITDNDFPFKEYIIRCKSDVSPPKYLLREDSKRTFDLRCLFDPDFKIVSQRRAFRYPEDDLYFPNIVYKEESNCLQEVNILESKWPMEDQLHLDSSQLNALKTAVTREFSIIQGPPGCGKTHLGLKIAKVLLHNRNMWRHADGTRAQMLVVCYTNHALDQFMEGICSFFKGDIVRVGGRSCNETMTKYNFKSIKSEFRKSKALPKHTRSCGYHASKDVNVLKQELNFESEKVKILKENIVHEKSLYDEMGFDHCKQFRWLQKRHLPPWLKFLGTSSIVEWLGIIDMATRIQNEIYYNSTRKEHKTRDNLVDKDLDVENREVLTEIDFDFKKQLEDSQKLELKTFAKENISLDFDEVRNLEELFLSAKKKQIVERERRKLTKMLQHNLRKIKPMSALEAAAAGDILSTRFTEERRWALYLHWVQAKCNKIYQSNEKKFKRYKQASARLKEVNMMEEKYILQNADIIGMTITGAANHKNVLREIKPTIMIVEEAAEVLESHLISNLTSGCEQLIMIGDHKQLKPKPNVYRLEREYNLDLSLFERMVRNGIRCDCLQIQHRMRPEIADNIRPIYKTLMDHESVKQYESVKGIAHNMFFIDHCTEEKKDDELKSYTNEHEVKYLIALCKYLLLQGYNTSEITILTTYKGQMLIMKKEMLKQGDKLNGVRMTIVDNYQGEENDIILLSLVRSNGESRIGYLARDNRVCVALSRAKKGLYIIGNGTTLSTTSELWKSIIDNMRLKGLVGKSLPICCQNHPQDTGIMAECSDDFQGAPEGGCLKLCDIRLECGHACGKFCHIINREHKGIICRKPCVRKCKNGHQCYKECWQNCICEETIIVTLQNCGHVVQARCSTDIDSFVCEKLCNKQLDCGHLCQRKCQDTCVCVKLVNVNLPCGHDATIPCSIKPEKHKCSEYVEVLNTDCGHFEKILCRDATKPKHCRRVCELPLDCGHLCKEICGKIASGLKQLTDEDRAFSKCSRGHITYCKNRCETSLKCGHTCKGSCSTCFKGRWHKLCTEECNCNLICGHHCKGKCGYCLPCTEDCTRSCRHKLCMKKCIEVCKPCTRRCSWKCKHFSCTQQCGEICDRPRCNRPCKILLPCKHKCIGMCGDPCPTLCRTCDKEKVNEIHFGLENLSDSRFVQLQDCGHLIKYDIMDTYMDIDEGVQLKRCPLCNEPIRNTNGNRYESIVNKIYCGINSCKQLIISDNVLLGILLTSASKRTDEIIDWIQTTACYICPYASTNYDLTSVLRKMHAPIFLACRDVVNRLNQLAIFGFVKSVAKYNSYTMEEENIFHGASLCLSSSQHACEIESELKRFLDRRKFETLKEIHGGHEGCCEKQREEIENANKLFLQDGRYTEEDRAKIQMYLHAFPETENIDNELLNLSFATTAIDRDTIIRKGYIDDMYVFQELLEQHKTNASYSQRGQQTFEVNEHQLSKKQCEMQVDSPSLPHVAVCVEHNRLGDVHTVQDKTVVCLRENNDSNETMMEQETGRCKTYNRNIVAGSSGIKSVDHMYKDVVADIDEKGHTKCEDGNILQGDNEEIEEGEIHENNILEIDITKIRRDKNQYSKQNGECVSRQNPRRLPDLEDGEVEDKCDMPEKILEFSKAQKPFNKDEGKTGVNALYNADDTSAQEDTTLCSDHKEFALKDATCTSSENNTYPKENLRFGEEIEIATEIHPGKPMASLNKGQSHVINLLTWPGVPYFHSEQSVFHLMPIKATEIQNSNGKGPSTKRPASDPKEEEPAEKKAKTHTGSKPQLSALSSNKRLNEETDETEPPKKKLKDGEKVSFTIQTKTQQNITSNTYFADDTEEESKKDLSTVPNKADTRTVIISSNKYISSTTAAEEQCKKTSKNKTLWNPFKMQKIHGPESTVAPISSTRTLVHYDDIDTDEDNHQDFESIQGNRSKLTESVPGIGRSKTQQSSQMPVKRTKSDARGNEISKCNNLSESPESSSPLTDRGKESFSSGRLTVETKRHTEQIKETDLRNFINKKKHLKTESSHSPHSLFNKKDGKGRSRSQVTFAEIEIEGEDWKILDTA